MVLHVRILDLNWKKENNWNYQRMQKNKNSDVMSKILLCYRDIYWSHNAILLAPASFLILPLRPPSTDS